MSKHYDIFDDEGREERPLTVCDRDCAAANHCRVGGYQCPDCGRYFCPSWEELDDAGRCEDCAERHRREIEEEELEEQEAKDGE